MKTIEISATNIFTPEMDMLRRMHYGDSESNKISVDEFDNKSQYVVAMYQKELVGMVRLTEGSPSPLQSWFGKNTILPSGKGIIELTRGVVAKPWRRFEIFTLLLTETLIKIKQLGADKSVTAILPEANHCRILTALGFHNIGETMICQHPQTGNILCQTMIQYPQKDFDKVLQERGRIINGEKLKNFRIISNIATDVTQSVTYSE